MSWLEHMIRYRDKLSAHVLNAPIKGNVVRGIIHMAEWCTQRNTSAGSELGSIPLSVVLDNESARCEWCLDAWLVPEDPVVLEAALLCYLWGEVEHPRGQVGASCVLEDVTEAVGGHRSVRRREVPKPSRRVRNSWGGKYMVRGTQFREGSVGFACIPIADLLVYSMPAGFAEGWLYGVEFTCVVGGKLVAAGSGPGMMLVAQGAVHLDGTSCYANVDVGVEDLSFDAVVAAVEFWGSGSDLSSAVSAGCAVSVMV